MNKKILKRKINFLKNPIVKYIKDKNFHRNTLYGRYYDLDIIENTIFYESRDGKSMTDNPFAIFQYLLKNPNFSHFKHIWSVQDMDLLKDITSEYATYTNVEFVQRNSDLYLKKLATSKYLVNNSTFQSFFTAKKEQVYINTWHGTPLKKMGFDIPGNPSKSQNVVRNFLNASFLLSPNQHTTEMYLNSFKLDGLYNGSIIEDGYPRIDMTFNVDSVEFLEKLKRYNVSITLSKKTLLYAPTWKGTGAQITNEIEQIVEDILYLNEKLTDTHNVLVKVHPFIYNHALKREELKSTLIPDFIDTNELLGSVDLLITDYSSIFFDFLVTDKPILFYMWDEESYLDERETYFDKDELPGATVHTKEALLDAIKNIEEVKTRFVDNYKNYKDKFASYDDGNVTQRLINFIFNNTNKDMNIIKDLDKNKEKIIFYVGGMKNNGITSSILNLLDNIDYSKFDVTCFLGASNETEVLKNMNKVNENVRFLFKTGQSIYALSEFYKDAIVKKRGIFTKREKLLYPKKAYKKEVERLFGHSKFDYAIDFSGYSFYWAKYIVNLDAKKKICFMHSDLLADSERIVNKKRPHRQNLRGLFSIYNMFDELVGVSESSMMVNKENLSIYAGKTNFDYVLNSINYKKILDGATIEPDSSVEYPIPKKRNINFVTMGRLSPEKGHDNLIKAFHAFHNKNVNSNLYIVGNGPLKKELEQLIEELGLNDSVFLTGQLENPFSLLNQCDCFVLSSHYEGQPMVLLEAMTLKLGIIATDITANRYVLNDGEYGMLVENSVEGLSKGFGDFAENRNNFIFKEFDYVEYNKKAVKSFYDILKK